MVLTHLTKVLRNLVMFIYTLTFLLLWSLGLAMMFIHQFAWVYMMAIQFLVVEFIHADCLGKSSLQHHVLLIAEFLGHSLDMLAKSEALSFNH